MIPKYEVARNVFIPVLDTQYVALTAIPLVGGALNLKVIEAQGQPSYFVSTKQGYKITREHQIVLEVEKGKGKHSTKNNPIQDTKQGLNHIT